MLNIGPQELLIILIIALIVVGPQRLPGLGRSIGRSLRELRNAQDEVKRTIRGNLDDEPPNGSSARAPAPSGGPASGAGVTPGAAAGETIPPVSAGAAPTASEPLPADNGHVVVRVVARSGFSEADFAAQKASFEEQVRSEQRLRVWNAFVASLTPRYDVQVDWQAIRAVTG